MLFRHVPGCRITPTLVCVKVKEAKVTEVQINVARENYRPAAERASLLYFILSDLYKINLIYQFSLKVDVEREVVCTGGTETGGLGDSGFQRLCQALSCPPGSSSGVQRGLRESHPACSP